MRDEDTMKDEEFESLPEVPESPDEEQTQEEDEDTEMPEEEADEDMDVTTINETENMELLKEDNEFILDLAARGMTINLEEDEIKELKKLLDVDL